LVTIIVWFSVRNFKKITSSEKYSFLRYMNKNLKLGSLCFMYHLDFATKCVARAATLYHDMYTVLVLYNIYKKILYCTKKTTQQKNFLVYRWLFLRMEQKLLPKLASESLKSFISQTMSVKPQWFRIFSVKKSELYQSKGKTALRNWFQSEISRISNFHIWVWEVIFVPFSEIATC